MSLLYVPVKRVTVRRSKVLVWMPFWLQWRMATATTTIHITTQLMQLM